MAAHLNVENLKVRSLDVRRMEVSWETTDSYADPRDFTLQVLRSESPEGPFDPVSPEFEDRFIFVDNAVPPSDRNRQLWYQLRIKHKATGAIEFSLPRTNDADPDLVAQYIRRTQLVGLSQAFGRRVWFFKRRTFGLRCTCYDTTLGQRTRSHCALCYDTTYMRGYFDPIEVWMQIDPSGKQKRPAEQQVQNAAACSARMGFYPNVSPGDVIVEAENKRWRVDSVTPTERLRAVVHQELTLVSIHESDIEYRLPLNLDVALRDIQPSPVRMFTLASDLADADSDETPDIFANYPTRPRNP